VKTRRRVESYLGSEKSSVVGDCPKGGDPVTSKSPKHCIKCIGGDPDKIKRDQKS